MPKRLVISSSSDTGLSRRQSQIMEVLYRRGRASVAEVMVELSGNPTYSTVRNQLRTLEQKGRIRHEEEGLRYVYLPKVPRHAVRRSVLRRMVDTFFEGSSGKVMAALIGDERTQFTEAELDQLEQLLEAARKRVRQ